MLKIGGKYYTKNNADEVTVFEYESMLAQADMQAAKSYLELIDLSKSVVKPINIRKSKYRTIIDAQQTLDQSPQFMQVIVELFFDKKCQDDLVIEWYATVKDILRQLKELVDLEEKKLKSPPIRNELKKAGVDNLNVYGVYNRVRNLMESLNLTYNEVLDSPYEEIFVHLSYDIDRAWIEHRLEEHSKSKNK